MKRIAIFAHFDKKNIIDDYVVFAINELKKVCNQIIFVSCCDLPQEELKKLDCHKIVQRHDEYDFGSYKRGFLYAQKQNLVNDCDEILFVNDSCYGPFKPLDKIFAKMEKRNCDFWGLTKNKSGLTMLKTKAKPCYCPHIQTYFFVLRKKVFNSECFKNFIISIKKETLKNEVIMKYETGLTKELENAGFVSDYAIKDFYKYSNPTISRWRDLYKKTDFPYVKCSVLRLQNTLYTTIDGWHDLFTQAQINLIEKNLKYTARKKTIKKYVPRFVKNFIFQKIPFKRLSRLLIKKGLNFLTD